MYHLMCIEWAMLENLWKWSYKSPQKLKSRGGSISFSQQGKPVGLNIVYYSDATYASLEDGSSLSGFIIFVLGKMNRMAPIY